MKQKSLKLTSIFILSALILGGCGSNAANNGGSVSQEQKIRVLNTIGNAFKNRNPQVQTLDASVSSSTLKSQNLSSNNDDDNYYSLVEERALTNVEKDTFNNGKQNFSGQYIVAENNDGDRIEITNLEYIYDSQTKEVYQEYEESSGKSGAFHAINASYTSNNYHIEISRSVFGEYSPSTEITLVLRDGYEDYIESNQNDEIRSSINYPFIAQIDVDNDGNNDEFFGTFIADNVLVNGPNNPFVDATVRDVNNVVYGIVRLNYGGELEVFPSEGN
jgi:hypothetical protein